MAIEFTARQKKVLDARNHNILVSAAAGSGKTAVLTQRILRMISEGDDPIDIDRLLVVTFTNAAAAQMRDRIGKAISAKLLEEPGNLHLQRQEVLLHNAKITTIDSFCTFLLRNNFAQIGLDPGFRQMDQTEADLLRADALEDYLEKCYEEADSAFLACVDYFSPGRDDRAFGAILDDLYKKAVSHPDPAQWLRDRASDYDIDSEDALFETPWMQFMLGKLVSQLQSIENQYDYMLFLCGEPDGPWMLEDFLRNEKESILSGPVPSLPEKGALTVEEARGIFAYYEKILSADFGRFPSVTAKRYPEMDPGKKDTVKSCRDGVKKYVQDLQKKYMSTSITRIMSSMDRLKEPVRTLSELAEGFLAYFGEVKKEKGVIDFPDLENLALQILADRDEEGNYIPTTVCSSYRQYFAEVMIDEYQDSNEIQELILSLISSEDVGRYNRFMVGDVKQSIYKFRLARPEIFLEKYGTYRPDDAKTELIELDANFRSRREVIDSVNTVFSRIMRAEIGGIEYTPEAALKAEAAFPPADIGLYRTELILTGDSEDEGAEEDDEFRDMNSRQREALAVALRIRELVGTLPVRGEDGTMHPCRYGDICVLLRSGAGWFEDFRTVFEAQGIPAFIQSRTGYFSAREIRVVLDLLRVLDNPRQDIPLYGVMRGYFGGFEDEELALLRAEEKTRGAGLYELVRNRADRAEGSEDPLAQKCRDLLSFIDLWRGKVQYMQVHDLISELLEKTGYENYCRALPGGEQRAANLQLLLAQAASFDRMALSGLFDFIRYIDQMKRREVDFGEANLLDENADVVRLMTIHKSKGLEFPVCIVAGLAKDYSYKRRDTTGSYLCENDWGIGADVFDTERRVRYSTLRKEAVAEKIRMDSLGEELRVLYVAMTRAKEKLILVGKLGDVDKKTSEWDRKVSIFKNFNAISYEKLPVDLIGGSESFLNLIWYAMQCGDTEDIISVRRIDCSALTAAELEEQKNLALRKERLMAAGEREGAPLPLPEMERELDITMSRRYAGQSLAGLYTKTTVSELKMAAMEEEGEGAAEMFEEKIARPVLPFFAGDPAPSEPGGASYGTAVHRILELFDYERFKRPEELTLTDLKEWLYGLAMDGKIPLEYAQTLYLSGILKFTKDPLARRMALASARGKLYREQPFVLGIEAPRLNASFPKGEYVLIQGVIDAYFEEDGELILVDYKTDRVENGGELISRYKTQIDYYEEALTQITGLAVGEKILFSTSLGKCVRIPK